MTPKQFFLILFAHRYIAAAVFALVTIAGAAVTILTPKSYVVSTDLLIDARDPVAGQAALIAPNYLSTQIAIIQSERVAVNVVKRLRVAESPKLVEQWKLATKEKMPLENFYATLLRKGLKVEPLIGSNVIRLTFEGNDPAFVTSIVNTYAQTYLDLTVDLRVEPVRQYAAFFDERLKTLRADIEVAQTKLSNFQKKNGIIGGSDERADQETLRLDALTAQLVALQGENMALSSRQKTSGSEFSPDVLASPAVQGIKSDLAKAETKLSEMRINLGPNHPSRVQLEGQITELKQQLEIEMRRVSGGTNAAKNTSGLREAELRSAIAAQKARVLSLRSERDQISVLAQDVEAAKRAYDAVLQRSNQINLEKQSEQANVSVLSPAVEPVVPATPNRPKYIVSSLFLALLAAVLAALGLEFMNRKIRTLEDIMIEGVPLIGVIERRDEKYSFSERLALFGKFFTKRKKRKEFEAASRLEGLI